LSLFSRHIRLNVRFIPLCAASAGQWISLVRSRRLGRILREVINRRESQMSFTIDTTTEIRPFRAEFSEDAIDDLRHRLAATRWPGRELVDDRSQGVQLATMQELAAYWAAEYDFDRIEKRLNAFPQFTTEVDGVDIHFVHVRSPHENALP